MPWATSIRAFAAWVNPAGAPIGMLAEFLAAVMNPSAAGGDHAAIYVEHCVVRWLMELIDFPVEGSAGILVGGGSVASLYCLAVARHWAAAQDGWNMRTEGLQGNHPPLVLYISEEGHSCLRKSSHLLGLGEPRIIPVDERYKMDLHALREAVMTDRKEGRQPFCVVGSAGTVNTGAVDPLDELADFCAEQGLWLHVDGAYGAFGILDPNVSHLYTGLERADSVALDPHKWLATPIECSCAIVRQGDLLRETFSLVPPYLRTEPDKGIRWDALVCRVRFSADAPLQRAQAAVGDPAGRAYRTGSPCDTAQYPGAVHGVARRRCP